MRSTAVALMLVVLLQANAGCSLIFTKGPQPEVQPPPPCTTSNVAPALDTTGALLSAVVATAAFASTKSCSSSGEFIFCSSPDNIGGIWAIAGVSTAFAALFTTSAIVGFNRTAVCRTSLGTDSPALSPVPESSFLLLPERQCPTSGDVPRVCSSAAPWGPSAVVLGDVTSRGGAP